jgi:serine/threonine-protein kinase
MADEQWQKVREIFDAALRQPPEVRPKYLHEACGEDTALLAEVESLFSSYDNSEDFLKRPAVAAVADLIEADTKRPRCGQRFGHYEIIEHLGAGGMGEVYLAQDTKLDRQVAVKFLNDKHSGEPANLERFVREAKAASALNHPNILVIHEIGATDEAHFIVSEYVQGQTLRHVLADKALSLAEVLDIAIQIANALAAAHAARLVHRDIKPENVMLRPDGLVKILDFGLAKLITRKNKSFLGLGDKTAPESQTAKGMILGTVHYMSPEQAKGERVDERTDIFSFGVMLYEMLAGQTPFAGASVSETFANVINAEPPPLAWFVQNAPEELQRIIGKALRKDRDARYQTMKGLLADLKECREQLAAGAKLERAPAASNPHATTVVALEAATGGGRQTTAATQGSSISIIIKQHKPFAAAALAVLLVSVLGLGYYLIFARKPSASAGGKKYIAVLPLKPLNIANRDEDYETGIAESLIVRLNLLRGFIARPLSATRNYTDLNQDPLAAGKEQQADYVLAANYQVAGGKIRVTAQLYNVASGEIEDTYQIEKETGDVFAVQDAVAGKVGQQMQARFATTSGSPSAKRGTTNEEAYRLYLQGRNLTLKRTAWADKRAIECFEQAIKLDPNYAQAYARMAHAYQFAEFGREGNVFAGTAKAKELVNKALQLDNNLAEAYMVRGTINLLYEYDFPAAEKDLLRAIELEPNNDTAHWHYALLLAYRRQFDQALVEIETAQAIDPSADVYMTHRGRILYYARRYDDAIVQFKQVLELDENLGVPYAWLRQVYAVKGNEAEAYEWFMIWQKRMNPDPIETYQKAYETAGWPGVQRKRLELFKPGENKPGNSFFDRARLCALLGEKEQAFDYLNKAFEQRDWAISTLNVEPALDSLRGDPRYAELVSRVGLK